MLNQNQTQVTQQSNLELKNLGFTKLVKREQGVYENVTATGNEKKYMKPDDPSSLPHLKNNFLILLLIYTFQQLFTQQGTMILYQKNFSLAKKVICF